MLTLGREVRVFQDPREAENVISKTRMFTDSVYPWAGKRCL